MDSVGLIAYCVIPRVEHPAGQFGNARHRRDALQLEYLLKSAHSSTICFDG
jgi:hypothetical protein